LDHFF